MSGGEHFVIPHHHYHYYHRILKRSCAERRKPYELLVRNRQGTVLVEVLVRIAEEMENND